MNELTELRIDRITPSPHNPRVIRLDDPAIMELAASIKAHGLLQPVVCRPLDDGYELLAGRRRFEACLQNNADTILAIVRKNLDDAAAIEVTVLENLQRENLTPLEEARGVNELLQSGKDVATIALNVGKSAAWVYRRAKLVDLIPEFRDAFEDPKSDWSHATAAHLELIARLPTCRQARLLSKYYLADRSVSELADTLDRDMRRLSKAPWKLQDDTLETGPAKTRLGSCADCQKRSDVAPLLFHEANEDPCAHALCLDPECWTLKAAAYIDRRKEELSETAPIIVVHSKDADYHERADTEGALDHWTYEKAKKSTPGAKRALVVDGGQIGKEIWIKPNAGVNTRGEKTRMPALPLRRKAHVIREVAKALDKAPQPFKGDEIQMLAFVAAFGTYSRETGPRSQEWNEYKKVQPIAEFMAEVWKQQIRPVLSKRLRFFDVQGCDHFHAEALRVAELIGLDVAELEAAAALALPGKSGDKKADAKQKAKKNQD